MSERKSFEALRTRAFEVADTGRYYDWKEVATAMEEEGFEHATFRLRADPILQNMITARCIQAKAKLGG